MKLSELRAKATELGIEYAGVHKSDLIELVYAASAAAEGFKTVEGILQISNEGYGWIRTGNYMEGDDDAFVHQQFECLQREVLERHLRLRLLLVK